MNNDKKYYDSPEGLASFFLLQRGLVERSEIKRDCTTEDEDESDTRDPLSDLGGNPGGLGRSWDGPLEGPKKAKKPQKMGFLGGQK